MTGVRVLFIPAAEACFAETVYRLATSGEIPLADAIRSLAGCRAMVASFGPDIRQRLTIWRVAERFGPDGLMVVAEAVTDNVVAIRRPAAG
ncbi:hypothetical protein [Bosea sp. PAMC 26642]|uniref:hypothetical protein n=1 Tax=Bosea sp. (strain PAMC 26642) TaxID=1792307 RepID=UPI00077033AB|nr:hypothetical protein [Bosea sp. PAMC 26642]AMJ60926.1 hypothetical protein AXW83_12045 [Bosea sp. PAMC 26642]